VSWSGYKKLPSIDMDAHIRERRADRFFYKDYVDPEYRGGLSGSSVRGDRQAGSERAESYSLFRQPNSAEIRSSSRLRPGRGRSGCAITLRG